MFEGAPFLRPISLCPVSSRTARVGPGRSELLVKACRGSRGQRLRSVWDLTAGLGRDSAVLAAAVANAASGGGAMPTAGSVVMFERCPVVAALLADAVDRISAPAAGEPPAEDEGAQRGAARSRTRGSCRSATVEAGLGSVLSLVRGDALELLEEHCLRAATSGAAARVLLPAAAVATAGPGPAALLGSEHGSGRAVGSARDSATHATAVGDAAVPARVSVPLPEVVYLDPMFPPRGKAAKVKGEMQLLHRLLGSNRHPLEGDAEVWAGESEGERLLALALRLATKRVVVKRPVAARPLGVGAPGAGSAAGGSAAGTGGAGGLAGGGLPAPSHAVVGETSRFDVYLVA